MGILDRAAANAWPGPAGAVAMRAAWPTTPGAAPLPSTDALNRFLAGVERRAYRMALVATASPEDALDIVQDAMLGLAERYGHREPGDWGPLFQRILQSRIRDWYRRARVRNRWRVPWPGGEDRPADPAELAASPELPPDGALQRGLALGALEAGLRALPLRQQQAFVLRVWEGFDTAATAQAMGCSTGSVKTHLSRALASLREKLGEHR